jgi:hydrogenase maturation protease
MSAENILVLGIGNVLWADEGFGVRVVQALEQAYEFPASVTILDGGTQGLALMPYVQEAKVMVIIDAVDFHLPPGDLVVLHDAEVPAYLGAKKMSLHQISFQEVLALCQLSGAFPPHIMLVGVQPEVLEDYGGSLSPRVKSQLQPTIARVMAYLGEFGIQPKVRSSSPEAAKTVLDIEEYERLRPSADLACRIGDDRFM